MTTKDLMLRDAALIDYAAGQLEQVRFLLNVLMTNYGGGFAKWSNWGCSLAVLEHQMGEHSAYLYSTALLADVGMPGVQTNCSQSSLLPSSGLEGNSTHE